MGKYIHDPAPSQRAQSFIAWCAQNISEWPVGYISCARFIGSSSKWWRKNVEWRTHHNSLSHSWVVCTKSQWDNARIKYAKRNAA